MTKVDDHIKKLGEAGEAEPGQFTMDRERAREQMQTFQLSEPQRYVLELVQAAVARSASRIEFEIDADDMHMRFDGGGFDRRELYDMYGSLFLDGNDSLLRGRQQLALGLNAAMALNPKYALVESGNVRMEMRPGKDDVIGEKDEAAVEGTHIHIRRRWRPDLVVKYMKKLKGTLPEVILIKERCVYSQVAVHVNGVKVSCGMAIENAVGLVAVEASGFSGVAGFLEEPSEGKQARVALLKDGVWITTHAWPDVEPLSIRFVAIVEGTALRKDLSQSEIVRNEAYDNLRNTLTKAYFDVLFKLTSDSEPKPWLEQKILNALSSYPRQSWKDLPFLSRLAEKVSFKEARGSNPEVSLQALFNRLAEDGEVLYATRTFPDLNPSPKGEHGASVYLADDPDRAANLFDNSARCVDDRLNEEQEERRAFLVWQKRPMAHLSDTIGETPLTVYDAAGVRVECRVADLDRLTSEVYLVKDGCILCTKAMHLPLGGTQVLVEAPFTPTNRYDDAVKDEAFVTAMLVLADGMPELLARMSDPERLNEDNRIRDYLSRGFCSIVSEDPGVWVVRSAGLAEDLAEQHTEQWRSKPGANPRDRVVELLSEVPLFHTFNAGLLSLAAIRARVKADGKIWLCGVPPANIEHVTCPLFMLSGYDRMILEEVLPEGALQPYDAGSDDSWWERVKEVEAVLDTPGAVYRKEISTDGVSGVLFLPGPSTPRQSLPSHGDGIRVTLLKKKRMLGQYDFYSPAGPLVGTVSCDALSINPTATGPRNDQVLHRLGDVVQAASLALLTEVCTKFGELTADAKAVVSEHLDRAAPYLHDTPGFDPALLLSVLST